MKIIKLKRFILFAFVFISVVSIALIPVSAAPVSVPQQLPNASYFRTESIISFDEPYAAEIVTPWSSSSSEIAFLDEAAGANNGSALKLVALNRLPAYTVTFSEEQDWSQYQGIMYYIDITNSTVETRNGVTRSEIGAGIRIYSLSLGNSYAWVRNSTEPKVTDVELICYYYQSGNWVKTDPTLSDGERLMFPEGYKGWVYVPFTSYISDSGSLGVPEAGILGLDCVTKISFLCGPLDLSATDHYLIFDDVMLVEEVDAPQTTAADTTATSPSTMDVQWIVLVVALATLVSASTAMIIKKRKHMK